jgi:hypothetical protein
MVLNVVHMYLARIDTYILTYHTRYIGDWQFELSPQISTKDWLSKGEVWNKPILEDVTNRSLALT